MRRGSAGGRRLGCLLLPQCLSEAIDAHLGAPGGHEHGEQLPALQPLDPDEHAVAPHLQGTKDVDGDARDHDTILASNERLDHACGAMVAGDQPAAGGRQVGVVTMAATTTEQGGTTMPFVNVKLIKGVFDRQARSGDDRS